MVASFWRRWLPLRRSASRRRLARGRSCRPHVESLEHRLAPAYTVFSVCNANDSGPGSLRQAILDANNQGFQSPGAPDLIRFQVPTNVLPGGPPPTIDLLSPLPIVQDSVWIVAETEWIPSVPVPNCAPEPPIQVPPIPPGPLPPFPGIELNGQFAGPGADGLIVTAPGSLVSGVVINRFSGDGVFVNNGAFSSYLRDSYIGTDGTGRAPLGNGGDGVLWAGGGGYLGSFPQGIVPPFYMVNFLPPIAGMFNSADVIVNNRGNGVFLASNANQVMGDTISGNGSDGVLIQGNGNGVVASTISGNANNGVHINGGNGNDVGLTASGQNAGLGNTINGNGPAQPGPGTGDGVLVDAGGNGNPIHGNTFIGNTHLPIELLNNGNLVQTAPSFVRVTSAQALGTDHIEVDGIVGGTPNSDYVVEVYVDRAILDTAGDLRNGVFLGSVVAHVGALGSGGGAFQLDVPVPFTGVLTGLFSATVTDPGDNTSAFSPALQGEEAPARIAGQVFLDANGNGQHAAGASGLDGWTVQLLDARNNVIRAVQTQDVDLNGDGVIDPATERGVYQFTNLLPLTTYKVREVLQAGAQQTSPAAPGMYVFTPHYGEQIAGADFGDLLVLPTVQSVVINDGSAQRSMVTKVTVTFSTQVTIDAGAFQLIQAVPFGGGFLGAGDVSTLLNVALATVNGRTVATLTFAGAAGYGGPVIAGSLPDGQYTLTTRSDRIHDSVSGAVLDGTGNGMPSDRVDHFFRLFGDATGDGKVDNTDLAAFRMAYRSRRGMANYRDYFDYNGDGVIDSVDYFQFMRRLGTHIV
jgi:hypothetical protein